VQVFPPLYTAGLKKKQQKIIEGFGKDKKKIYIQQNNAE
jgi:hypothetical protein